MVPASAATLLKDAGFEVIWLDAIAEGLNRERFFEIIKRENPEVVAFEAKTPVIKQLWKIIDELKVLTTNDQQLTTVLFGDHVTALPEESLRNSRVDFVLTGGDFDFLLLNLCNFLKSGGADKLEPGIFWLRDDEIKSSGRFRLNHDLNSAPFIDRELTRWELYSEKNGNYKRTPGTYIMSGRDCWWGRCSFCSWPTMYPEFRSRNPEHVLTEAQYLIDKFEVREIMDDTGCFPVGAWLEDFCRGSIKRGINKKVYFDCNMRFGALSREDFALLRKANFRLLLFGLESANQKTLDRINKKIKVQQIIEDCKAASCAGLFPHITIMFGYPWETYADALATLNLGRCLLKKGYAYTMQATIVIPYPGTALFEECRRLNLLRSEDWDDYDMKRGVMKSPIPDEKMRQLVQGMYRVSFSPEFVLRRIGALRDFDDFRYGLRAARKVFGHILDFGDGSLTD
jgi:radical SAM superfamily enzyme YgiQ (UPF0313 family)